MVNVSNKQNSAVIKVTSSNGNTIVTAKADSAQYWSNQSKDYAQESKNWANKLGDAVDGIEYSAKHYANLANLYVEGFEDVVNSNTNDIITTSNDYINQITETANESISNVENKVNEANELVNAGIANINTTKNTAVDDINATKTNILKDIEFVADGEKEEIQELADKAKDDIESTGFYMRDDKLYFINSEGQEEEFKSGGINDKITNCLLEVPQRIKLEQQSDKIILKAGSVVIIPDGFEADGVTQKFEYRTISTDMHILEQYMGGTGTLNYVYNAITDGIDFININDTTSSTSQITTGGLNYNLSTNNIKIYSGSDVVYSDKVSLPFMQVSVVDSQITSVVAYNGMGYIGSTVWVDKGVKGLIPNGRNEDGSLNNIEYTTISVLLNSDMHKWGGQFTLNIMLYSQGGLTLQDVNRFTKNKGTPVSTSQYVYSYDEEDNYWYYSADNGVNWVIQRFITIGSLTEVASNKSVSNFQPKQPFRAVDYNDKSEIVSWCVPDYSAEVAISSGYIAPTVGVVNFSYRLNASSSIKINNTSYGFGTSAAAYTATRYVVDKGDVITFSGADATARFYPLKGAK